MTRAETVLGIIRDVLDRSGKTASSDAITVETDLLHEGYADSFTLMTVMLEVERRFQCAIPATQLSGARMSSASRITGIVDDLLGPET